MCFLQKNNQQKTMGFSIIMRKKCGFVWLPVMYRNDLCHCHPEKFGLNETTEMFLDGKCRFTYLVTL